MSSLLLCHSLQPMKLFHLICLLLGTLQTCATQFRGPEFSKRNTIIMSSGTTVRSLYLPDSCPCSKQWHRGLAARTPPSVRPHWLSPSHPRTENIKHKQRTNCFISPQFDQLFKSRQNKCSYSFRTATDLISRRSLSHLVTALLRSENKAAELSDEWVKVAVSWKSRWRVREYIDTWRE